MMEVLPKEGNETARQYANRVLRHNIQQLILKPRQLISEGDISEQLRLSRTPIREAFKDLEKSGIVYIEPQKGTFVAPIDIEIVLDACFLRLTLEKEVIALACAGISDEYIVKLDETLFMSSYYVSRGDTFSWFEHDNLFHKIIFEACNKGRIYDYIEDMMIHFNRVRLMNLQEVNMSQAHSEHLKLFDAIKQKDEETAVHLIESHLTFCINTDDFSGDLYKLD